MVTSTGLAGECADLVFNFRKNERFTYEYDFGDCWEHSVRSEARLPFGKDRNYPPAALMGRAGPQPRTCRSHRIHGASR